MKSLVLTGNLVGSQIFEIARCVFPVWLLILILCGAAAAQIAVAEPDKSPAAVIIENDSDTDVFGFNKNILIRGSVTKGVMTFGGDVIVEGRVQGDVAVFGGSVVQKPNSFIGGDVLVFGGTYHHGATAPMRDPASHTVIYAGFGDELREIAQNPASLAAPDLTATYLALRILTVLFWFVVSLILTAIAPNAIGRSVARLKTTAWRLALIGGLAAVFCTVGVEFGLTYLPAPISVAIGLMTLALLFLAVVFGRVCIHHATGKLLLKIISRDRKRSESVALLLGAIFWTFLLSIPFVWTAVFAGLLVVSLGVVLTARSPFNWKFER